MMNQYLHAISKSPRSGVTLCVQFVSATSAASAAAKTFPSHVKTVWANLWYLAQRIYGSGEMYWMTFPWPWHKVTAAALLPWSWLLSEKILEKFCWKLLFWQSFFKNFGCVFSRSNTILAISQEWLVWLMWNEKEVHWLDTGYNIWPWPLTSLMTLTLDVSRSNFEISGIVGLIDVKWKGSELIWYWADCMTLPFDHNHDLDLGVSRSESGMGRPIDNEWKGCESSIHDHDIDLCDQGGVGGCTG